MRIFLSTVGGVLMGNAIAYLFIEGEPIRASLLIIALLALVFAPFFDEA